jgi:hypothetical protein
MTAPKIVRRMRVTYRGDHNPPVWAAYYEPPGRSACYCHAETLEMMWAMLCDYFRGNGLIPPLCVQPHMMKYVTDKEKEWAARSSLQPSSQEGTP